MLALESRCILVVLGGVLISRMRPNHYRITKNLLSISVFQLTFNLVKSHKDGLGIAVAVNVVVR